MASQELAAEVLNIPGFVADANGNVFPVAKDLNLGSQPYAISVSQRFD